MSGASVIALGGIIAAIIGTLGGLFGSPAVLGLASFVMLVANLSCLRIERAKLDWRDSRNRRWFGLLGLLNLYVLGPVSGWVLGYRVTDDGKLDGWLWMKRPRA